MKIIKSSVNEKIICECGCEFIYNFLDIKEEIEGGKKRRISEYDDEDNLSYPPARIVNKFVYCPECNHKHIISRE